MMTRASVLSQIAKKMEGEAARGRARSDDPSAWQFSRWVDTFEFPDIGTIRNR
jgi:hypothetical protein